MGTVFIEITCADIDSRSFQVRCDHRDVAERAGVLLEAEAANELREVRVITVIEYSVIPAAPIQFNDNVSCLGKSRDGRSSQDVLFSDMCGKT